MALLSPLALAEARSLGRSFGLSVARVEPLAQGSVNSNFSVETDDGARYFARIYEEQAIAGAEIEARLLAVLDESGVPVVRPLVTSDGAAVIDFRGKPFAVFPWVAGDWLCLRRVTAEHCRALGAALARVHLASPRVGRLPDGRFRPEDMLARLAEVEAAGASTLAPSIRAIRDAYAHYLPLRSELPLGVCHGDLFRDNVLWRENELAAFLDFESASHGSFVYDLMVTLLAWCYTDGLVSERARALFEGYAGVRILSEVERAALEVEGALACLRFATTRITDFELRAVDGQPPARDFRRFLARLRALESKVLDPLRSSLE